MRCSEAIALLDRVRAWCAEHPDYSVINVSFLFDSAAVLLSSDIAFRNLFGEAAAAGAQWEVDRTGDGSRESRVLEHVADGITFKAVEYRTRKAA